MSKLYGKTYELKTIDIQPFLKKNYRFIVLKAFNHNKLQYFINLFHIKQYVKI